MKIYFAAAISAGRQYAPVYHKIVEFLKKHEHQILTEHVAAANVLELEERISAQEVFARDIEKLNEADMLVAEVSLPSTGVGYEIAYFLGLGKPVLCLFSGELKMSKMITGNSEPLFSFYAYESEDDLLQRLPELVNNHRNMKDKP